MLEQNNTNDNKNLKLPTDLIYLLEAIIFSSVEPSPLAVLEKKINEYFQELSLNPVSKKQIQIKLDELCEVYKNRAVNLVQLSSGYCFEINSSFCELLKPATQSRSSRPSKAYLETITLIAYKQPITRSEIEAIRGVSVSSNIIRDLLERDWIKVAGHKNTPGMPAIYETTKHFLDSFHLQSLQDLPQVNFEKIQNEADLNS